jgi:hypothetical protein
MSKRLKGVAKIPMQSPQKKKDISFHLSSLNPLESFSIPSHMWATPSPSISSLLSSLTYDNKESNAILMRFSPNILLLTKNLFLALMRQRKHLKIRL